MSGENAALLVMDFQEGIVERFGDPAVVDRAARAIAAARGAALPVIYVKVDFRPGFPEVSPHNRAFSQVASVGFLGDKAGVHPDLAPEPHPALVPKRRVSPFPGSAPHAGPPAT